MCTLSWTDTGTGYELFFNRDERLSRGPEEAPRESRGARARFLAPRDSEAGGTWISVNEFGVTSCLLNAYVEGRGAAPGGSPRSRGLLILESADAASIDEVLERIGATDLSVFQPFVLCSFQPSRGQDREPPVPAARAMEWDGIDFVTRLLADDDAPLCSSGVDAPKALALRRAEWARLSASGPMDSARLAAFHRSHLAGADACSPCMHRADAETRSLTRVRVEAEWVSLRHTPGAPCRTTAGPPLTLNRRPAGPHPDGGSRA